MKIAANDDFETRYVNLFRSRATEYGLFVEYEKDRAAIDIGMNFTQPASDGTKVVLPEIAWFQLKGITAAKLSAEQAKKDKRVSVTLETRHLEFWRYFPSPIYLVVFVESLDTFLVLNLKRWTSENAISVKAAKTAQVHVPLENELDESAFRKIRESAQVPVMQEALKGDEAAAIIFCRDDQLVKWIATAKRRNKEVRATVVKYGSKLRSEVYFEEREVGVPESEEWRMLRGHWHFMMRCVTTAFPYLSFEPRAPSVLLGEIDETGMLDRSNVSSWFDDDENVDYDELLILDDGRAIAGEGQFERMEYQLVPSLNDLGQEWFGVLSALEEAELMVVEDKPMMVSVAPFNREL